VISRCLTKQRAQRYQTAKELRKALDELLPGLPVGAGGLRWKGSIGTRVARVNDNDAPPRPEDDSPELVASRLQPTISAPVVIESRGIDRAHLPSPARAHRPRPPPRYAKWMTGQRVPFSCRARSSATVSRSGGASRQLRAHWRSAAPLAIALPISGKFERTRRPATVAHRRDHERAQERHRTVATDESQTAERPPTVKRPQPAAAGVSSAARSIVLRPRAKPQSTPRAGEPSKSKSITKVESAGFERSLTSEQFRLLRRRSPSSKAQPARGRAGWRLWLQQEDGAGRR